MAISDINARKLKLISHLLQIDDEETFAKVEELLNEAGIATYSTVSEEAIRYRVSQSEKDIAEGNTLTQEEAERESEKWGK